MKILIIGSSGMLGTALERICWLEDIACVSLTHADLEIGVKSALHGAISLHSPDVVINTAAMVGLKPCEDDPVQAFAVNTVAAANLARICAERQACLVQISTHTVFDGRWPNYYTGYYTEGSQPNPLNIYGMTKYAAEILVANICERHYIVRLPTLFGPRHNSRMGFPDKVLQWIAEGRTLRIADDKIDSPSYTLDVADRLVCSILEKQKPYGIYHIANTGAVSFYDFVLKMVEIMGAPVKVERAKDAEFQTAQNPLRTAMGSVKLPLLRSWEEALEEYLKVCQGTCPRRGEK